jgi:hypothetical protein
MRRNLLLAATVISGLGLIAITPVFAQMHKVAKPEDIVRAVGVYEWTGDRAKPTASRLIPVTVFIDGEFQDAGVYLSRPVPFALNPDTIYEIDKSGVPEGTLDLVYARNLRSAMATTSFDDGWFGYGKFAPPPPPKKKTPSKPSQTLATITSSKDDVDSDRPTLIRRPGSSSDKTPTAPSTPDASTPQPPDDPDRPHLTKKKTDSPDTTDPAPATDSTADKSSTTTASNPASDPDRPTLKKRTPEEAKKARKQAEQSSASGLATSLNDDPYRPTLHHGKGQQELTEADLPKLKGVPANLQQAVAVSDAKDRPVHDFTRPWADDTEEPAILAKMQALARAQLAAYAAKKPTATPVKSAVKHTTPNSKLRRKTADSPAPAPIPLVDERLSGYTLSYGGAATYVYTARTDGEGDALQYVTIVAQMTPLNELAPALQSVTDATHLDRTPWMRLVDVVDADASNRASLLFELRGQTSRQFALYRVIAARSEQTFLTGSTQ